MVSATPSVLIDANVPRTAYERCCVLFEYLVGISEVGPHSELDPGHEWQRVFGNLDTRDSEAADDSEVWNPLEDKILEQINRTLPDELVCTLGEWQPGDVIVREVQDESEEMV
jgi:hypothetical protein